MRGHRLSLLFVLTALLTILGACTTVPGANGSPNNVYVHLTDFHITSSRTQFVLGVGYHFIVTNNGQAMHEFMIMPQMNQPMPMSQADDMALKMVDEISPGQTKIVDYTFMDAKMGMNGMSMPKALEFDCMYPGHYEAGMRLAITTRAG